MNGGDTYVEYKTMLAMIFFNAVKYVCEDESWCNMYIPAWVGNQT